MSYRASLRVSNSTRQVVFMGRLIETYRSRPGHYEAYVVGGTAGVNSVHGYKRVKVLAELKAAIRAALQHPLTTDRQHVVQGA